MKKLSPAALLGIAALMSLVCGFLVYGYLDDATPEAPKIETSPVVVATMDIAVGSKLEIEMLALKDVPKELVQEGAIKELEKALGQQIKMPVSAGDQITAKRLKGNENTFVKMIPPDKRALTLGVTDISGVAGFIRPAMYVDVVGVIPASDGKPAMSRLVVQNVYVLAVGSSTLENSNGKDGGKEEPQTQRTVTVALTPEEAVKVKVAQQEGTINLMLRPENPTEKVSYGAFASGTRGIREKTPPPQPAAAPASSPASQPTAVPGSNVTVIRGTSVGK